MVVKNKDDPEFLLPPDAKSSFAPQPKVHGLLAAAQGITADRADQAVEDFKYSAMTFREWLKVLYHIQAVGPA